MPPIKQAKLRVSEGFSCDVLESLILGSENMNLILSGFSPNLLAIVMRTTANCDLIQCLRRKSALDDSVNEQKVIHPYTYI